jgi:hypothetical protein
MRQAEFFDKPWKNEGLDAGHWHVIHFEDTDYTIFIDPVMDSGLLSDDLFEEWMRVEKSVESWIIKFFSRPLPMQ